MIDFGRMSELIREKAHMQMAIAREKAKAERITATFSRDGGGGGGRRTSSRVEDGAIALVVLRDELSRVETELEAQRGELKPYLDRLDDLQRICIRMRYLEGMSCVSVAEANYYSKDHIYHVVKAAEKRIYEMQFRES